jgi:thioredoxin reductase
MKDTRLPVAIIGAGPVGLAAAAHLTKRNIPFVLFESGNSVGSSILKWEHVRVFSTWKLNIDKVAKELLKKTDWVEPDENMIHTGREFVDQYLKPLAELPELKKFIFLNSKVVYIGRKDLDKMKSKNRYEAPFTIHVKTPNNIIQHEIEARAVIDATGTWLTPNPVGSGGHFALGEMENASRIFYGIPDVLNKHKARFANKRIAVIGAGHSAINTILELDRLKNQYPQTEINWILRKKNISDVYGGQEDDALEARGALGVKIEKLVNQDRINIYTPFYIQEIRKTENELSLIGDQNNRYSMLPGIDEIISNTGSRPDFSFLREIRLSVSTVLESSAAIEELIDPNIHSCGTVRAHGELELQHAEKDFYIAGSKSYGRAPTFLMATGYEQVRSLVAALDGDLEAARRVELELPETGVCSGDGETACCVATPAQTENQTAACCG